jgi:ferredoxin
MEAVFIKELKPFLDAVARQMELYVPKKSGDFYVYTTYDAAKEIEFNPIRTCTPAKEFLFALREVAAVYPKATEPEDVKPFAVFGLKDCDIRSIEILDKVFTEEEFEDPFYKARREKMFIIASDCTETGESCNCVLMGGRPFAYGGFDLNVSAVSDGFIIEAGSEKGTEFIRKNSELFSDMTSGLLAERDRARKQLQQQLENKAKETVSADLSVKQIIDDTDESEVFDEAAKSCVECQACTRICPTCHCFYLYDTKRADYFAKMKMWDSCMRMAYAQVAGGENPRKVLGDRMRHRLLHKFVFFADRYGVDMCVGCGRCVDSEAGGDKLRLWSLINRLSEQYKQKGKAGITR